MPSTATITAFYTFAAATTIRSSEHNTNYSNFRGHIIPVDPNTATAATTLTYDLGSDEHRWRRVYGKPWPNVVSTTGSMTLVLTNEVVLMDSTAATTTATLFAVASNTGATAIIKNIGTGSKTVIVDGNGAETIDNTTTIELIDGESAHLITNGTAWYRI
jgi:hypothetical protein